VTWRVEFADEAARTFRKLDRQVARRISNALGRLQEAPDPADLCKALYGPYAHLWRYRVGDWRVICDIQRGRLVVLVLEVGHRSSVYE